MTVQGNELKEIPIKACRGLIRQRAVLQPGLIRVLLPAPVDDGRVPNRIAHRPVNFPIFLEIDIRLVVERPLPSVGANVAHQLNEQLLVNPLTHDVFVRPYRHRLGEGPLRGCDKLA